MEAAADDDAVAFVAPLWRWDGEAAWHFVTLPQDVSDDVELRAVSAGRERDFGSVRVEVTVGATTWRTSLFPDKERGAYLLPVKHEVRVREELVLDAPVGVSLQLVTG